MSLFNELMASAYLLGLFALTDFMGRNELKIEIGLGMLFLVTFTIAINIIKVVV